MNSSQKRDRNNDDDTVCHICDSGDNESEMLLCDGCDRGFHIHCINLQNIPSGSWYCPRCNNSIKRVKVETKETLGPQRVYIYERVSTKGQNEPEYGRVGLNTQNDAVLNFCREKNLVVAGTVLEVGSAFRGKTPELDKLIKRVKKNEPILVYSFSRFSRNVEKCNSKIQLLHAKESYVWSVTDGSTSKDPTFNALIQAAENESRIQSNRVSDSFKRIKDAGGYIGRKPFGYNCVRDNVGINRLHENPVEQAICKRIRVLFNTLKNKKTLLETVVVNYPKYKWNSDIISRILDNHYEKTYKVVKSSSFSSDMASSLIEETEQSPDLFYPEAIKRIAKINKKYYFLVKWEGLNDSENTFEEVAKFHADVPEIVNEFLETYNGRYGKEVSGILKSVTVSLNGDASMNGSSSMEEEKMPN
jgi:DNA invertase Pin-like site-specific DNA recombinase